MKVLNYTGLQNLWTNIRNYITAHIPTKTSDLTNDSNFVDTSNSAVSSGITSAKVTAYDSHVADTDIHVTTADKTKWNNGVSQAYVFRYSSSSVTDNSTIAYSTLDNTDNIKSGDKVIDVDGKIFSIVSVDTANQTVTVGSALVDLAKDSDVVHKSGNETITGTKTFENVNIQLKSTSAEYSVSDGYKSVSFFDKNLLELSRTRLGVYSSGLSYIKQTILGYDSNNQQVDTTITFSWSSLTKPFLRPDSDNLVSLGTSGNRWKDIYATNYYYGSDNVEFSTKFVTSDTAQTISGVKTFSSSPVIYNSDTTATTPQITFKNSKVNKGSTTDTGAQLIYFTDKNDAPLGIIESRVIASGNTLLTLKSYNLDTSNNSVSGGLQVVQTPSGTRVLPTTDEAVSMGNSLFKWSDVATKRINKLAPSSLSLPSTRDNAIDISSYFTNFNNGGANQYSPTVDGWIYLETTGCNALHCFCTTTNNLTHYGNTVARGIDGLAYITFPVLANTVFKCTWYTNSTITLNKAWFIPCQGNV